MARRQARELAFRALFQADRGGVDLDTVWTQVRAEAGETRDEDDEHAYGDALDTEALSFAQRLVYAYRDHHDAIDDELAGLIQGWTFPQMSQTDLNVLRLALTELRYEEGVPARVTLEMAVRLAKRFGGEDSGRFVNGVLGAVYRKLHPHTADEVPQ